MALQMWVVGLFVTDDKSKYLYATYFIISLVAIGISAGICGMKFDEARDEERRAKERRAIKEYNQDN